MTEKAVPLPRFVWVVASIAATVMIAFLGAVLLARFNPKHVVPPPAGVVVEQRVAGAREVEPLWDPTRADRVLQRRGGER
jgi:hypothetical protein